MHTVMHLLEFGDLLVSDTGEVEIELKRHPRTIEAKFIDLQNQTPCHHSPHDKLECHLVQRGFLRKKSWIVIKWSVSGSRKVMWSVFE